VRKERSLRTAIEGQGQRWSRKVTCRLALIKCLLWPRLQMTRRFAVGDDRRSSSLSGQATQAIIEELADDHMSSVALPSGIIGCRHHCGKRNELSKSPPQRSLVGRSEAVDPPVRPSVRRLPSQRREDDDVVIQ